MALESNIARREKLLSNPGYVNNAPKALVEEEKIKLENEKKELAIILEKLKQAQNNFYYESFLCYNYGKEFYYDNGRC